MSGSATEVQAGPTQVTGGVVTEVQGRVLLIGLNRPDKRNALTPEMLSELSDAYSRYDKDENLRCAVLYGEGAVYCAGADLTRLKGLIESGELSYGPDYYDPFGLEGARVSKPVVTAVHGMCFAGGLELALNGDIIIAAEGTAFGQPEVLRGLFAFGGGAARWADRVGWGNGMRYLLTGEALDAKEAHRIGLVQEVVPADRLRERAIELATVIANAAPIGVRHTLTVARQAAEEGLRSAFDSVPELRAQIVGTDDAVEGVVSFKERRAGDYKGR
ncbi:crotonase/enoyl-CoA hydratase family protein [Hoyosella subflava]|uniref:Enoyl-CoA hydratase n=1 Tax=Hoyosella subflava (strain DSM 45089 / JCM 17490 / NBRC 109087 / DQS3-9A1) TaxID=443218 RepID=F6EQG4_HOYSD|nr:crotonase/enoyl-CoA hydratase family protein [Hoyosella subflava]AEF40649.1 Enoyl-CoA hydratase [Hoyosella subflava DQS3-9A1]